MHDTSLWIGLGACAVMALLVGLTALGSRSRRSHGRRSNVTDPGGYWIPVMGEGGGHSSCDGGSSGGGGDCGAS